MAGVVLGVVSRVDEVTVDSDVISSNLTWLATAFAVGALGPGAAAGVVALTAANAGYYAYVLASEPGRPLASVAGPVERWFALGIAAGVVFGAAGALLRSRSVALRAAAFLPLAAVAVAERVPALSALLP